jgi:predicted DNA repair protein MutK
MKKKWYSNPKSWKFWFAVILLFGIVMIFNVYGFFMLLVGIGAIGIYLYFTGRKKEAKRILGTKMEWVAVIIIILVIIVVALLYSYSLH